MSLSNLYRSVRFNIHEKYRRLVIDEYPMMTYFRSIHQSALNSYCTNDILTILLNDGIT